MQIQLENINNQEGGCMGMCSETGRYRMEIQKQVPGGDAFATVYTHETRMRDQNVTIPEFYLYLSQMCNANLDARIRFSLVFVNSGKVFNHFESTVNQIKNGQMQISGSSGASLTFRKFDIFIPPTFVDYLRAGW